MNVVALFVQRKLTRWRKGNIMSNKYTRRSFLTTLGALGAAASFDSVDWLFADDAPNMPKKNDSLSSKPVLTIAHVCDPQFGFGLVKTEEKDVYAHDLERFERELELINASKPDVVFFAGDMCNAKSDLPKDWPRLLKAIESPVLVAPGNHDIPDPVVKKDVDAFCEVFGAEYASLTVNGWKLIVVNSQYCRDTKETELYERQLDWFQKEIASAKEAGTPVILGSHVPPFVANLEEKDEYFNFPTKVRQDYLDYLLDAGCKFYLAGHTHTTLEREYRGIQILNGETTSRNFDKRSYGFRMLKIDAEMNYEWNFVEVEHA